MSAELPDDLISGLIRRAMVPKGFRPRTDDDLDRALDAMGQVDIPERMAQDIVERILRDEPPRFLEEPAKPSSSPSKVRTTEELVEMFKCEGEIPPDIEEELRELEREAGLDADDLDRDDDEVGNAE